MATPLFQRRNLSANAKEKAQHQALRRCLRKQVVTIALMLITFWFGFLVSSHWNIVSTRTSTSTSTSTELLRPNNRPVQQHPIPIPIPAQPAGSDSLQDAATDTLPLGFKHVFHRAQHKDSHCRDLQKENFSGHDTASQVKFGNETVASLPAFGIIDTVQQYKVSGKTADPNWQCVLPPDHECSETQFTVVFMAYNPDRLGITLRQIQKMLERPEWDGMVKEIVLVWNGPRSVDESKEGQALLDYAKTHPVRVTYPLKMGFANDLMNRYHPDVVQVTTKAIMFYDDDGPFYSFNAVLGGFELWKRHSSAQVGAMARQIDYGPRQQSERHALSAGPADRFFISHCTNVHDEVDYNFKYFANFDANMVLPSGSFLHSNYLCFLWHPVLEPVREFVRAHPVHPDDVTVSMVVSQLSGRAPRVYSRRCEALKNDTTVDKKNRMRGRRLMSTLDTEQDEEDEYEEDDLIGVVPLSEQRHRQLLFGIDWDAGAGMTDAKHYWAALRTEAVNALVQYFGSINSGSIGWCYGTEFYNEKVDGKCKPVMAKQGWLPWMNPDHTPRAQCP
jgi:hypothetical protein